ncbi:SPOR domain-containing protein [Polaribacter huanghezhanensis]|uniref:SPOR domain-containing protein n=1 Tax=Polaribacter huanghezhanensis TaxID=1354726 RepID=UPI0026472193|nr:SPOR domain-containing protein [Polaribacter huanghezhanensis]
MKSIFVYFLFTIIIGITNVNGQTNTSNEVKSLIKKKIEYNKKNGYGFRIQLESGHETAIKTTQSKFRIERPTIKTYILFESPEWKVQVGDYKTRLEADKILNEIKKKFPSAIIVPR